MKPKNHTEDCGCDRCRDATRLEQLEDVVHVVARWSAAYDRFNMLSDVYFRDHRVVNYVGVMEAWSELQKVEILLDDTYRVSRATHRDCARCRLPEG